ncbi:MAG: DUF3168 domain-containing protein [Paracoccaceae bacterium]
MSYFSAAPLQEAVFNALQADATLAALIGGRVYDAPPEALTASAAPYVLIGDEQVRDRSSATHRAALHDLVVSIYSDAAGFADAKAVAGAVSAALDGADLNLGVGHLVQLQFFRARTGRKTAPGGRSINLTFRALVQSA